MGNKKPDCSSVCTAILEYGTAVEIFDRKYQSGLRFSNFQLSSFYSHKNFQEWQNLKN